MANSDFSFSKAIHLPALSRKKRVRLKNEGKMSRKAVKKVAIVTGSTKGIGRSIALEFAAQGISVVVTSRSIDRARQIAEEINANRGEAVGLEFNLEIDQDLNRLIEDTIMTLGQLDILVNNALSAYCALPLQALSDQRIRDTLTTNITNVLMLSRVAYPYLKKNRGTIINIGSVVINRHLLGLPLYGIVKGALAQMTRVLAAEWAADGIRVNSINPGFIRTEAFSELGIPDEVVDESYDYYKSYQPIGRIGQPEEIGKLAAYLASDDASFITGSIIDIDGGYSIKGLPLYLNSNGSQACARAQR